MDWPRHYDEWVETQGRPGNAHYRACLRARRRVSENTPEDWRWLAVSLLKEETKLFVAKVFAKQPVPRRLFRNFLRAAVHEGDPSLNRYFIEPCIRSYGGREVAEVLFEYLEHGSNLEKAGAASAFYWCLGLGGRSENLRPISARFQQVALQEFVANGDLDVRRRILPMLILRPDEVVPELASLAQKAIAIARADSDEYLRHRVEIQLGTAGPYRPLPPLEER